MPQKILHQTFRALVLICGTLILTGCYNQQQTITVHEDGRAEMTLVVTFPKEMQDVAAAVRARAVLDPQMTLLNLDQGLCEALNSAPIQRDGIRFKAREIVSPQSFTCRIDIAINDFPEEIAQSGPIAAMAGLTATGERQYRYEMRTLPMALGELAWRGIVQQQFKEQGIDASPEQLNAIVASDKAALQAVVTMMFRGATSVFTIRAPEIIETNGEMSTDRTSATFRTKIADALAMVLEPGTTETPYVVFRY